MLIKKADDQAASLAELERKSAAADSVQRKRFEDELRARRAGIRGEAESAYLIDFHFGETRNWSVLHDLRVEVDGQVAQIDHLLINRCLEFYVLETKRFHAGVRINEEGEFESWNSFKKCFEGMPSPLLQNQRHIEVLKKATKKLQLPTRLGIRMPVTFETLILVSPSARITRPKSFDTSRVIKADQLRDRIWKDIDSESILTSVVTAARLVSSDTVENVARQMAALHRPLRAQTSDQAIPEPAPRVPENPKLASPIANPEKVEAANATLGPVCKKCSGGSGAVLHGQYGYYFKCGACQSNTALKLTCISGHKPRLRKQGNQFFRECGDCGTSELYFLNA